MSINSKRQCAIEAFNTANNERCSKQVAAIKALYEDSLYRGVSNSDFIKPPFHVVEPSLWFITKRAWSKFKNFLINKLK